MKISLRVWRQRGPKDAGKLVDYAVDCNEHMSFLEMLDVLNDELSRKGEEPIAFDHDCREGICGACGFMINGQAHGPLPKTTVCQTHMRTFKDGDTIVIEPFRAKAFPVLRDLMVDRSAFDRIIQKGGYVTARAGSPPDGNAMPIGKDTAELAFDAAACIGCGACVAACPNAAAMLFTSAKVGHLGLLPQGQAERDTRVIKMVNQMHDEEFGHCTNMGECEDSCPKGISIAFIARMNRDYVVASIRHAERKSNDNAAV